MKTMRGFTTIELMIVIAIIGIIAAIAIPNIRDMTAANRQLATSTELITTFNNARNSAISLSREVLVKANDGDWTKGWTVTAIGYTTTGIDGTATPYPDEPLSAHDALSDQMQVTSAITSFTYNRQGRLVIAAAQTINVCDDRVGEKGRSISLEPIGRVSVTSVTCE